jgi:peptide/nickel transport system substrate-binding protein
MATGVCWIVSKKYIETVGNDAFKSHPVGLGPYRLVGHQPGIEVVLEANTDYWRRAPHVKRLVMKSVPEATTRLAMLKQQGADVAYGIFGTSAEEVHRDSNLKLEVLQGQATQ